MFLKAAALSISAAVMVSAVCAQEGPVPEGIPHLDHVFVIMMENHGYPQILNNPDTPFITQYANKHRLATNYFAVAHPSFTNYLEVVGGSNFGILNDNPPDWHNAACTPNLLSGINSLDNGKAPDICPIYGTGTEAATPAIDYTNEASGPPGTINIDGKRSIPASSQIVGKTIADQLATHGLSWKSYQESLPPAGADLVNYSDGFFTDKTNFDTVLPGENQTSSNLVDLYAAKHDPFIYFRSVQEGTDPNNSLANVVSFNGPSGLFFDLRWGKVPTYSFIVPNQCNDMHGRGNAGPACEYDPNDNGTQSGLNPGLIRAGDYTVENIVGSIHRSPTWKQGNNAIVLLWDENDYSVAPIKNQVVTVVDTNYGPGRLQSSTFYDHFSLLKSIEGALGLPCLNHACDKDVRPMSDLFARGNSDSDDQ